MQESVVIHAKMMKRVSLLSGILHTLSSKYKLNQIMIWW